MKVSKGNVISDKDLEVLLDRSDLLGEKMLRFTLLFHSDPVKIDETDAP